MKKKANNDTGVSLGILNMVPVTTHTIERGDHTLGVYLVYPDAVPPEYATPQSACFDLRAYLGTSISKVDVYNRLLYTSQRNVMTFPEYDNKRGINIEPGESAFIPTGLIFDIPENYQLLGFPRSGLAGKKHLKLSNCVGIIDSDYVEPSMIIFFNDSQSRQVICHGDRIAQAQVLPTYKSIIKQISSPPERKTSRAGGLGHTGVN